MISDLTLGSLSKSNAVETMEQILCETIEFIVILEGI